MNRRCVALVLLALLFSFCLAVPGIALADEGVAQDVASPSDVAAVVDSVQGTVVSPVMATQESSDIDAPSLNEGTGDASDAAGDLAGDEDEAEDDDSDGGQLADEASADEAGETDADTGEDAQATAEDVPLESAVEPSEEQKALDSYAAQHGSDLTPGCYAITSQLSSTLALDIKSASTTNGAQTIVWTAKTSGNVDNQRWSIAQAEGGYYTISSVLSGLYLDVTASTLKGAPVVQWSKKSGSTSQQWIISKESDGTYKLTSALLDSNGQRLVLDVSGGKATKGASVVLWSEKTSSFANQRWSFSVPADALDALAAKHKGDVADGTYIITSKLGSSLVLDVKGATTTAGAEVIVWPEKPTTNQGWTISHTSQGYVMFANTMSGKVLDVDHAAAKAGTIVLQWNDKKGSARNQLWIMEKQTDGSYRIISALAGSTYLVLDVKGGKATSGANTILWGAKATPTSNQLWTVKDAPEQFAHVQDIADGTYVIRTSLDQSEVLDVSGPSKDNNAKVALWQAKAYASGANQRWKLTHDRQGFVHLTNEYSGLELGIKDGATVQKNTSMPWVVEAAGSDQYRIRYAYASEWDGDYLGIATGVAEKGAAVTAYAADGTDNQLWYFSVGKKIVIALDPGHGGSDSGAAYGGYRECDMTWAITQAAAKQLRSYGYEVYITVSESEFKNSGKSAVSISERVKRAANYGCTAIFSMHINAGGGTGAVVLVPNNSSYNHEFYTMGQNFAKTLLPKINAIGIGTWSDGAYERNYSVSDGAEKNLYYTVNGKSAGYQDYYGIVRYARLRGMFGVIIEHGFIDNSKDLQYLKQSSVLSKLGVADAQAIKQLFS